MSQPRKIKSHDGTKEVFAKQILIGIIANRTGPVSVDEVFGAFINNWQLPEALKQYPRRWIGEMLTSMLPLGLIVRTGTHIKSTPDGNRQIAMYDITPAGVEFLASGGGVVPKYKPEPPPLINENGALIPRDCVSARINRAWPAPVAAYRNPSPAAAHLYAGALA